MQMFDEDTSWEAARKSVRFTAARLAADPTHRKHEKAVRALLAEWGTIEQARRDADDGVVDANALVAYCNDRLDDTTGRFVRRLRNDFGGDDNASFRKFFEESPSEVINLGLESQIGRSKDFFVVAEAVPLTRDAKAILDEIGAIMKDGKTALEGRETATIGVAKISLRVQTWKEKANAARRSLENILDTYATGNNLPRDYAGRFFPASAKKTKKSEKKANEKPASP